MKVRNRILLLASLLLLVSVGGIGNIIWQLPHVEPLQQSRAIVHGLLLLGLFGAGLVFAVLELLRHEIINPIFQLTARIIQMRDRKPDGQLLELTGNRNIDSLAGALNDILAKRTEKENELENTIAIISRLKDIINQSGYMIFIWKILPGKWPVEFVSDNVTDILGYSADDFISGRVSWPAITHPDDVPRLEKEVALYLEKGVRKWSQEYRLITKSGEIKWFRDDNLALEDSSGKIITIQAIVHDITGRKRAEEALRIKDVAIASSIDGIAISDLAGNLNYVNGSFLKMWGYDSEQEVIGKSCFIFWKDQAQMQVVVDVLRQGGRWSGELNAKKKDGTIFPVQISANIIMDPSGNVLGLMASFLDITEPKKMEERLEKVNRCLLNLGADFNGNITSITALCGELLGGDCALYNCLQEKVLYAAGQWHVPPDFTPKDSPCGHICYDVIRGPGELLFIPDLLKTGYAETDPNVRRCGLKSYIGHQVRCGSEILGSLCVVFQQTFSPTENDRRLLSILASALSAEEERNRAELKLRVSEDKYRMLFENSANGILASDYQTKQVLYANPSACRMLGYSERELTQMHVADIHPQEFYKKVLSEFEAQMRGEKIPARMLPFLRKDKTVIYADINASSMVIYGRKCTVGFFTDVSGQVQAELRSAMLSRAIETAHHGCLIISEDARLLFVNDYGLAKLGLYQDKIKAKNLFAFCAEQELVKNAMETVRITGRWMGETSFIDQGGRQFPVLVSISRLDKEIALSGASSVLLFQDISIQKEIRDKLLISEKLAVMGRLVEDVAHEINNPLAIIIGGTQLILGRLNQADSELQSQLERILRNAKRCKTILLNLLGYGRTVNGKVENISIHDLIQEAIDNVSFQYDMSGIEVVFNHKKQVDFSMLGNKDAMLSVFINLIRNARQAMGPKGRLTISLEKDKDLIRIAVSDTGIGMSREQTANLYKPFVSGWKEGEGTGLGLATSLGIIETHGGRMSVYSEGEGKGATFTIVLPSGLKEKKAE